MGLPKVRDTFWADPYCKDYDVLGSFLGSLCLRKPSYIDPDMITVIPCGHYQRLWAQTNLYIEAPQKKAHSSGRA